MKRSWPDQPLRTKTGHPTLIVWTGLQRGTCEKMPLFIGHMIKVKVNQHLPKRRTEQSSSLRRLQDATQEKVNLIHRRVESLESRHQLRTYINRDRKRNLSVLWQLLNLPTAWHLETPQKIERWLDKRDADNTCLWFFHDPCQLSPVTNVWQLAQSADESS